MLDSQSEQNVGQCQIDLSTMLSCGGKRQEERDKKINIPSAHYYRYTPGQSGPATSSSCHDEKELKKECGEEEQTEREGERRIEE